MGNEKRIGSNQSQLDDLVARARQFQRFAQGSNYFPDNPFFNDLMRRILSQRRGGDSRGGQFRLRGGIIQAYDARATEESRVAQRRAEEDALKYADLRPDRSEFDVAESDQPDLPGPRFTLVIPVSDSISLDSLVVDVFEGRYDVVISDLIAMRDNLNRFFVQASDRIDLHGTKIMKPPHFPIVITDKVDLHGTEAIKPPHFPVIITDRLDLHTQHPGIKGPHFPVLVSDKLDLHGTGTAKPIAFPVSVEDKIDLHYSKIITSDNAGKAVYIEDRIDLNGTTSANLALTVAVITRIDLLTNTAARLPRAVAVSDKLDLHHSTDQYMTNLVAVEDKVDIHAYGWYDGAIFTVDVSDKLDLHPTSVVAMTLRASVVDGIELSYFGAGAMTRLVAVSDKLDLRVSSEQEFGIKFVSVQDKIDLHSQPYILYDRQIVATDKIDLHYDRALQVGLRVTEGDSVSIKHEFAPSEVLVLGDRDIHIEDKLDIHSQQSAVIHRVVDVEDQLTVDELLAVLASLRVVEETRLLADGDATVASGATLEVDEVSGILFDLKPVGDDPEDDGGDVDLIPAVDRDVDESTQLNVDGDYSAVLVYQVYEMDKIVAETGYVRTLGLRPDLDVKHEDLVDPNNLSLRSGDLDVTVELGVPGVQADRNVDNTDGTKLSLGSEVEDITKDMSHLWTFNTDVEGWVVDPANEQDTSVDWSSIGHDAPGCIFLNVWDGEISTYSYEYMLKSIPIKPNNDYELSFWGINWGLFAWLSFYIYTNSGTLVSSGLLSDFTNNWRFWGPYPFTTQSGAHTLTLKLGVVAYEDGGARVYDDILVEDMEP